VLHAAVARVQSRRQRHVDGGRDGKLRSNRCAAAIAAPPEVRGRPVFRRIVESGPIQFRRPAAAEAAAGRRRSGRPVRFASVANTGLAV